MSCIKHWPELLGIVLIWYGLQYESKRVRVYRVTCGIGGQVIFSVVTTNRLYERVVCSNGPSIKSDYGTWGVVLYPNKLVTNVCQW